MVAAVETSGVNTGVSRRLNITGLQAAVPEHALAIGPAISQGRHE